MADHRVVQVACGSRDAQTLALTDEGMVFSWGDGDFGKLGRGGSDGCAYPQVWIIRAKQVYFLTNTHSRFALFFRVS